MSSRGLPDWVKHKVAWFVCWSCLAARNLAVIPRWQAGSRSVGGTVTKPDCQPPPPGKSGVPCIVCKDGHTCAAAAPASVYDTPTDTTGTQFCMHERRPILLCYGERHTQRYVLATPPRATKGSMQRSPHPAPWSHTPARGLYNTAKEKKRPKKRGRAPVSERHRPRTWNPVWIGGGCATQ